MYNNNIMLQYQYNILDDTCNDMKQNVTYEDAELFSPNKRGAHVCFYLLRRTSTNDESDSTAVFANPHRLYIPAMPITRDETLYLGRGKFPQTGANRHVAMAAASGARIVAEISRFNGR